MFISMYKNTEIVQPKPIKFYDLHEALILFQTSVEEQEYCVSKIPVRTARVTVPEIEVKICLPLHRRIIGRPVKANVEEVKKDRRQVFEVSGKVDAEAHRSANQHVCPPRFNHLRAFVKTTPVWSCAPSPTQVPLPPMWKSRSEVQMLEAMENSNYKAEEWTDSTQVPRLSTPVWMRAPSPSELPLPPRSELMSSNTEGSDVEDSDNECYETASEGANEVNDEDDLKGAGLPSALAVRFEDCSFFDKGSVHDSGYSSASPHTTPSGSTSVLHHYEQDVGTVESNKLHWNISMGGDAFSFLLNAEHELKKTRVATRMTGATAHTHKGEGSGLHWNRSMGGDAMSFLLGAESKVRRKTKGKARAMPCGVV